MKAITLDVMNFRKNDLGREVKSSVKESFEAMKYAGQQNLIQ